MVRIVLGVIAGFLAWVIVWVGSEKTLSAILPDWYGAPQRAFEEAVTNKAGEFTVETRLLLAHIFLGSIVSMLSGFLAVRIAGENVHAPVVLGCLLMALGLLKAVMSWRYCPIWYHVIFTALLFPMATMGGKL